VAQQALQADAKLVKADMERRVRATRTSLVVAWSRGLCDNN
jgi:hypothetical protein